MRSLFFCALFFSSINNSLASDLYSVGEIYNLKEPFFHSDRGSYTIISNQGHVLTAFHNIASCVGNQALLKGFLEKKPLYHKSAGEVSGFKLTGDPGGIRCGRINIRGVEYTLEVVALGADAWLHAPTKFWLLKEHPEAHDLFASMGYRGIADDGDFAILKIVNKNVSADDTPNSDVNWDCVPFSTNNIEEGGKVWNLSFPSIRAGMPSSESFTGNYQPRAAVGSVFTRLNNPTFTYEDLPFDDPIFYSSVETWGGSSGSSLISWSANKVAGVIVMRASHREVPLPGSTVYITSEHIAEVLGEKLGRERFKSEIGSNCSTSANTSLMFEKVKTFLKVKTAF